MIDDKEDFEVVAKEIAKEISGYRREWVESLATGILEEMEEVEEAGFDPAEGRGRGPHWLNGE